MDTILNELKPYLGTKLIYACPMTRGEYNIFKGWTLPANENKDDEGYLVQYSNDYISWSPKVPFEEAYNELVTLTIPAKTLLPHQERVLEEAKELEERRVKLNAFFNTEIFSKLDKAEQDRLRAQNTIMIAYSNILHTRINNF